MRNLVRKANHERKKMMGGKWCGRTWQISIRDMTVEARQAAHSWENFLEKEKVGKLNKRSSKEKSNYKAG